MNTKTKPNKFTAATVAKATPVEAETIIRTSLDMPESLSRRLRIFCATKGVYQRALIRELIAAHLDKEGF